MSGGGGPSPLRGPEVEQWSPYHVDAPPVPMLPPELASPATTSGPLDEGMCYLEEPAATFEETWDPPVARDPSHDYQTFSHYGEDAAAYGPDGMARNSAGGGLVSTMDSLVRDGYKRAIGGMSRTAVAGVQGAREVNDIAAARAIAFQAYLDRQGLRAGAQGMLSPGGALYSKTVEPPRSWESMCHKYGPGASPPRSGQSFEMWEEIAKASGRSNPMVTRLGMISKILGGLGLLAGGYSAGDAIASAPEEHRPGVTVGELGGLAGAGVGSSAGMSALILLSRLVTRNPLGTFIMGGLGGLAGGFIGGEAGRVLGGDWWEGMTLPYRGMVEYGRGVEAQIRQDEEMHRFLAGD